MPLVGEQDRFEQIYTSHLKGLLAPHGQFVGYDSDRAALDLGLHLYEPSPTESDRELGQVRVWFQLKGIRASTIGASELTEAEDVPVGGLRVEHLLYWFAHPEPVYLAVYVEALDRFLVHDVRDLVERSGGLRRLADLPEDQKTTTLRVPLSATLEDALRRIPRHRSLRLDGPEFRGRPLGHNLDPLRSELDPLAPNDFEELVLRLLDAHEFQPSHEVDIGSLLDRPIGAVRAVVGRLYLTYEWTFPLETEFGVGPDSDFRLEARPLSAQGDVLVVIHRDVAGGPRSSEASRKLVEELKPEGIEKALVFFNASDTQAGLLGGWRTTLEPMVGVPQGLGSLAFNVLTATNVYLEFLDRLSWRLVNLRWVKSPR